MKKRRTGFPKATVSLPSLRGVSSEHITVPLARDTERFDKFHADSAKQRFDASARDGYLGFLNHEATEGGSATRALVNAGVGDRDALLRVSPSWVRIGTFQALLRVARAALDSDPTIALELTTFVVSNLGRLVPLSNEVSFLFSRVQGTAWKEHGNALYMLERFDDALLAANRAVEIFSIDPFHAVHRANAQILQALIFQALQRRDDAGRCIGAAMGVLAEHGDARGWLAAVQVRAMGLFEQGAYIEARDLYSLALREAQRDNDERETVRIFQNLGVCALRLGDLDSAQNYITKAFVGFSRLQLDSELQRAIWVTASIEFERDNLEGALETLHAVYGRFLEYGMVADAARVLVEIGDVITYLTRDTTYAIDMCAKLAVTLGRYDVPAQVRKEIEDLRVATATAQSVDALRAMLARVVAFLVNFLREHPERALTSLY